VWISVCIISRIDFLCGFQRVLKSRIVAPQIETEAKAPYICWIFRRAKARALSERQRQLLFSILFQLKRWLPLAYDFF
jgi:hypothetical protein